LHGCNQEKIDRKKAIQILQEQKDDPVATICLYSLGVDVQFDQKKRSCFKNCKNELIFML
jgi:hypothetical protein